VKLIPLSEFGLMTVREVAKYHGTTAHRVSRWIRVGRLRAVPAGRVCLVARADCEAFEKPTAGTWRRTGEPAGEVPLADFGLVTVADFAVQRHYPPEDVRRWVNVGLIRAVLVPHTRLLRVSDCEAFVPPPVEPAERSNRGAPRREDGATR
jgi:excisionase family DNA binding protein